jgi:hypothetical protein
MEHITSATELQNAILLLEFEQAVNAQLLKEQVYLNLESLKPINLLKSTFKEATASPFFIDNLLSTAAGLASGYLTKKIVVGASGNILRNLFGNMLQVGVANAVAKHPQALKTVGQFILQHLIPKKK